MSKRTHASFPDPGPDFEAPPPAASGDPARPKDPGPQVAQIVSIHIVVIGPSYEMTLDLPEVYSWGYDENRVLTIIAPSADKAPNERVQHVIQPGSWDRVEVKMTYDRDLA